MTKIITITPNPALDLGGVVDEIKPNEKAYVEQETRYPGGNAINVARILHRLKIPVEATGFLGGGTGAEIKQLLEREGVDCQFVKISGNTRISVTVSNRQNSKQTRLSFPGPVIQKQEKDQLFTKLEKKKSVDLMVLGGSLPKGFAPSDIVKLIKNNKARGIETIVDCPGQILKQVIAAGPLMIKPNLEEFQALTRSKHTDIASVWRLARKYTSKVPLVCVSSVEGGTLLVTKDGAYFGKIAPVKIKSTVGAGDSMVGSIAAQIFKGNTDPLDLLRWGMAASAATLSHTGTAMGEASEIKRLYSKTVVTQL